MAVLGSSNLMRQSEKVCFLHDTEEFLLVHFAIAVCFIYHFLQLLICHPFTELFCHTLQIFEGNLAGFVVIKKPERFQDFVLWVTVQYLMCRHLQKLLISNSATAIIIDIRNHLLNFLLLWL